MLSFISTVVVVVSLHGNRNPNEDRLKVKATKFWNNDMLVSCSNFRMICFFRLSEFRASMRTRAHPWEVEVSGPKQLCSWSRNWSSPVRELGGDDKVVWPSRQSTPS